MLSKFLIALALVATATNLYLNSSSQVSDVEERFTQFITTERRSYFSKEEYKFRLEVFTENVKKIDQMNSNPNDEAEYGVNLFSDRTQEEFEQLLGLKNV
jgi:C1A family cysteine protease